MGQAGRQGCCEQGNTGGSSHRSIGCQPWGSQALAGQGTPRFCCWALELRSPLSIRGRGSSAFHGLGHKLPVTQLFCPVGHTAKSTLWLGGKKEATYASPNLSWEAKLKAQAGGSELQAQLPPPPSAVPAPPKCHLYHLALPSFSFELLLILQSPRQGAPFP
jgi:hypothetical protein